MVSLLRNSNRYSSGAVFLDASVNMDDEEYLMPVFSPQEEGYVYKLETIPIVLVPLVLGLCLEITGIVFVCVWPEEQTKCDTYFIFLYLHCVYWLILLITDHLVKKKHHNLRIYGYLEFYQMTYRPARVPLFIASLWTVCYLFLAILLHHTHKLNYEEYCRASEWFTPLNYILLLTTLELLIIVPVYVHYIRKVLTFNRLRPKPDVIREEWLSSFTYVSYAGRLEREYHHTDSHLEELLEKQADFIRYFTDFYNTFTSKVEIAR
ncbi:transmembrane protein 192 isoform X1 [Augochlora pura]